MRKKIKIEGSTRQVLAQNIATYFISQSERIAGNKPGNNFNGNGFSISKPYAVWGISIGVTNDRDEEIYYSVNSSNGYGTRYGRIGVRISEDAKDSTGVYSVELQVDEGNDFFRLIHAIQGQMPITSQWLGAFAYINTIDDGNYAIYHNATSVQNYKGGYVIKEDFQYTFWDLGNFAVANGSIALFNPGDGITFYKNAYRYTHNVANLTIADYSYISINGLGIFYAYPGGLLIPDEPLIVPNANKTE